MIDAQGEKWACEACIRGHRVSNCTHHERQLHHINKKGRPVSQCQHCRNLRKSRSAHIKCDCGEKPHPKDKCCHLRKAGLLEEVNGEYNFNIAPDRPAVLETICCCSHGDKCTCAFKRETYEGDAGPLRPAPVMAPRPKPRLITAQSEGALPMFANGRYRPAPRLNHTAQISGTPYPIPRLNSAHGLPTHSTTGTDGSTLDKPATKNRFSLQLQKSAQNPRNGLRQIKSERTSPQLAASTIDLAIPQFTPLELPFPPGNYNISHQPPNGLDEMSTINWEAYFASPSEGTSPVFSAGVNPPAVPWSAYDLPLGASRLANNFPQPPSFASAENSVLTQPGMTNSSSGAVSELGDVAQIGEVGNVNQYSSPVGHQAFWETPDSQEQDFYRLSSQSSCYGLPQQAILASDDLGSMSVDEFLKHTAPVPGVNYTRTPASQTFNSGSFYATPDGQPRPAPAVPTEAVYPDKTTMWPLPLNSNTDARYPPGYAMSNESVYSWNHPSSASTGYVPHGLPSLSSGFMANNTQQQQAGYGQSHPSQSPVYTPPQSSGHSPSTMQPHSSGYTSQHFSPGLPPTPQSESTVNWPLPA